MLRRTARDGQLLFDQLLQRVENNLASQVLDPLSSLGSDHLRWQWCTIVSNLFVEQLGDSHGGPPPSVRTRRACSHATTRDSPHAVAGVALSRGATLGAGRVPAFLGWRLPDGLAAEGSAIRPL